MRTRILMIAALAGFAPFAGGEEPTKEVRTEVRLFTVRDKSFKELHLPAVFSKDKTAPMDEKARMKFMEALTAKKDCTVLCAPAMTTDSDKPCRAEIGQSQSFTTKLDIRTVNGETVFFPGTEEVQLGLKLDITPHASADNKFIRIKVGVQRKELESEEVPLFPVTMMVTPKFEGGAQGQPIPFTQFLQQPKVRTLTCESAALMPDGHTVLLYLGSCTATAKYSTVMPLFNDIPYLNRLFRAESQVPDTEHFCMIVTAKIVAEAKPEAMGTVTISGMTLPSGRYLQTYPQSISADPLFPLPLEVVPASYAPPIAVAPPVIAAELTPAGCVLPKPTHKHQAILKILMEQYEAACKAGDTAKAKVIAAHCLELDPACFAGK